MTQEQEDISVSGTISLYDNWQWDKDEGFGWTLNCSYPNPLPSQEGLSVPR